MKINNLFFLLVFFGNISGSLIAHAQPTNVALNKPVTLNIQSTEPYTKDKNPAQLTDGKFAGSDYDSTYNAATLWIQKGALAWRARKDPIIITVDLEKETPISGVSFNTAAGAAGVYWPAFVGIFVSSDKKTWHYEGNLIDLSLDSGIPPTDVYSVFNYSTHNLRTKGRYIAFAVKQTPYTVTDEVQVFAGDDAWLKLPAPGTAVTALDTPTIDKFSQTNFVKRRVAIDIQTVRQLLESSTLSDTQKSTFGTRLNQAEQKNSAQDAGNDSIKTILPINDTHRDVMATYGEILAAQKTAPLVVWKSHRYAWLPFVAEPDINQRATLQFDTLKNEIRSDSFLLTNASGQEKMVELELSNSPAGAQPGWLQVNSVEWTDTYQGMPVADALIPVQNEQGKYRIAVPAGFTRKVWITVDATKLNPGTYKSTFNVAGQQIPLMIAVSKMTMQRPRLSLSLFDNSDSKSLQGVASRGITPQNKSSALALMKSHFVDSPWADRDILPWVTEKDFDAQHRLTTTLDFSIFDQWIQEWPDARYYFIFINAKDKTTFAGTERGTAEFNARLSSYMKVLSAHLTKLGLASRQISFLINDEPGIHGEWQDDVVADWARAIRMSETGLSLISDPTWKRPDLQKNQAAFNQMDILMPNTQGYNSSTQEVWDYYQRHRDNDKQLWLYACAGPVRLFNPQNYYRSQAWRVFQIGGKGMAFWAFNDNQVKKEMTSWNDYLSPTNYAPAFLDTNTVHDSVHWNAVREGVQDFEILSMLRDAAANSNNLALKKQAENAINEAVDTVIPASTLATLSTSLWSRGKTPELIDQKLSEVRHLLERIAN